jgi:hypothetical protein
MLIEPLFHIFHTCLRVVSASTSASLSPSLHVHVGQPFDQLLLAKSGILHDSFLFFEGWVRVVRMLGKPIVEIILRELW